MFSPRVLAFFCAALALVALASPVADLASHGGAYIPLIRRVSSTKHNGTFDYQRLKAERAATARNLQRIIDSRLGKRQSSEPLVLDDIGLAGVVNIGANRQPFNLLFDLHSPHLWTLNKGCKGCEGHNTYDKSSSSTGIEIPGQLFDIILGTGQVTGDLVLDTVAVSSVKVTSQIFGAANTLLNTLEDSPIDGVIGFGFPFDPTEPGQVAQVPFHINAFVQLAIQSPLFALKLSGNPSLSLGFTQTSLFTGTIEDHAISPLGSWQLPGTSLIVNGTVFHSGFAALIDPGTSGLGGSSSQVKAFYDMVGAQFDTQLEVYILPCSAQLPSFGFRWGGRTWTIPREDLILDAGLGNSQCIGALFPVDFPFPGGGETWILGDSFLKNVYSVFNFGTSRIGFAQLV